MYSIHTLENSSTTEITDAFNQAFADYVVPFSLTKEQLEEKMKRDSVDLSLSAGAYHNDKLVGFVLHGVGCVRGHKLAYNAGTGVIPSARGHQLTAKLYDFAIPILRSRGVETIQLEVISTNMPAIKTYQKIGFVKNRNLLCFKGTIENNSSSEAVKIKTLNSIDWNTLQSFWDTLPSWQNDVLAVENMKERLVTLGAYENDILLAYAIYNPVTKQIAQIAVDQKHRRQQVASLLINHLVSIHGNDLSFINVDENATSTIRFIHKIGLKNTINQYEMIFDINSRLIVN